VTAFAGRVIIGKGEVYNTYRRINTFKNMFIDIVKQVDAI
jgi:hypothetical protein